MSSDTRADSIQQLQALAQTLSERSAPSEHIAAAVLRDLASQLMSTEGSPATADVPAAGAGTGFGPDGAMGGWNK